MQKLGILGGLGPHTTSVFYLDIVDLYIKQNPNQRPAIELYSIPLDLNVEQDFIHNKNLEIYYEYLKNGLLELVKSQPDFIAIPCNSVHVFLPRLRELTKIPILSILESTADRCKDLGYKRIGVLSTDLSKQQDLYGNIFKDRNLIEVFPSVIQQEVVSKIISDTLLYGVNSDMKEKLFDVLKEMDNDVDCFVLGCTDLQLVLNEDCKEFKVIDSLKCLETECVKKLYV